MTDVLLTHSLHLASDAKQSRKMQPYPPLGTLYAATALRAAGIAVAVFDTTFADPLPDFREALLKHRPKIVAVYEDDFNFVSKMCLGHMRILAQQFSLEAKKHDAIVVLHGSDASDHPADYFQHGVDYVLAGEAEETLTTLCLRVLHSSSVGTIPGLLSGRTGAHSAAHTSARPAAEASPPPRNPAWSQLPIVARDLIDLQPYREAWTRAHGYYSTSVVASRGCPYRCNWCAKPISGDKFNIRNPLEVAEEVHQLKTHHGVQHIWFSDDVFALNRHWVTTFADAVEGYGPEPLPFKIQSRADLMCELTVDALRRAGCAEVWMGVESGSQTILDAMSKGLKLIDVHSARTRLARAGIKACYFLQLGYPGEGWSEILDTIALVRHTRPDDIGVSLSYPLPGTVFFENVQNQLGHKRNWDNSDDLCAMFTASYTDTFYHALRDALHAEVAGWQTRDNLPTAHEHQAALWKRVFALEPLSRNDEAAVTTSTSTPHLQNGFLPLDTLLPAARRA